MNQQENRQAYELRREDFWPYVGKKRYEERNAGIEEGHLRDFHLSQLLLGTYNLALPIITAFSAWGLERLINYFFKS